MTDITIPKEAIEEAARAAYDQWLHECAVEADESVEDWQKWDELNRWEQDSYREQAHAACLAMLRAWPGVGSIRVDQPIGEWCEKLPAIILPLPKEGE